MSAHGVVAAALLVLGLLSGGVSAAADDATLIEAERLFDVVEGRASENVAILVQDGRITAVGKDLVVPDGARRIRLDGVTVLPGLIDSHAHICLSPEDSTISPVLYKTHPYRALRALEAAQRNLQAGFTTLRDLDNEGADMADIAVRQAISEGVFQGPRLFVSGWALSITGGHMNLFGLRPAVDRRLDQLALMTDSRDAMIAAIRDQVKSGVDFIKIYATGTLRHIDRATLEPLSQLSEEDVRAMVEEAARWRRDVAAHAYGGQGARNAVAGGVRSIEHGMLLDDETLALMVEHGTFWSPTMSVYFPSPDAAGEERTFAEQLVARHRDTFQRAMARGVKIAFGTDVGSLPHGEGWRELELMGQYGMKPADVLRSATLTGAALLRRSFDLGRIAPGYRADIIAVRGRPDQDVAALRDVTFVMIDGRIARHDP